MISTREIKTINAAAVLGLIALFLAVGCVDTHNKIRHIDQHPGGDFNTVQTSEERVITIPFVYEEKEHLGIVFWNCQQTDDRLSCDRICDERWSDDRICRPGLHREFGRVSRPGAGVVSAKYRAQVRELEARLAEREERDAVPGDQLQDAQEEVAEESDEEQQEQEAEEESGDSDQRESDLPSAAEALSEDDAEDAEDAEDEEVASEDDVDADDDKVEQ